MRTTNTARRAVRAALIIISAAAFITAGVIKASADYGSGTLAPWQTLTHAMVGDWVDTPYDGDPTADVGLIGDSITTGSWTALRDALDLKGKTLAVNYWSGRPTTPAVDFALSLTTPPPVLIMATGTNDIFDPTVMAAQVARLRAGMPATTQIYWVDVQAARAATATADQRNSGWINVQIREGCTAPCKVIPWSVWFASNPSRIGLYLSDGVHPKAGSGSAFWAAVLSGAVYPTAKRR